MKSEIIIIGGGASALMLASFLPKNSATIIESNLKLGAKIAISGGGKCNITNMKMGTEYFLAKDDFIAPALKRFSQEDLLSWLGKKRLFPVLRKERQYFCEHSAFELVDLFVKELRDQKVLLGEKVLGVRKRDDYFIVTTDKRNYRAKYVVVASGGLSFPKLGASAIGYEIAESFEHTIIKTAPALVGFTVQKEQFFFKELSGASCEVKISVDDVECKGDLLFAHKGVSGPAVLDASLYWEKGQLEIDFLPHFSFESLKGSKKQISSLLPVAKRITKAFLVQLGVPDKAFVTLSKEELEKLYILHHYKFAPAGTFGYSKAEVTKGGVSTDEVNSHTFMSQKVNGLYFVGEVLDVTGRLGGYNFQWAFSSAYSCAKAIKKTL
jgi:predicted Rossmann fold flavoprotein